MRLNDIVNDQVNEVLGSELFKKGVQSVKNVFGKGAAAGDEAGKAAAAGADAPEAALGAGKIEVPTSSGGGARTPGEQARIQAAASPNPAVRQAADPFNLAGKQGDEIAQAATKADDAAQAAKKGVDPKKAAAAGAAAGAVGVGMLGGSTAQDPNKPGATGGASSQEDIDKMNFGQAFKAARAAAKAAGHEATGQFTWRGKPYQTNVQGEPYVPMNQQKKVSISAPQTAPAAGAAAAPSAPATTQAAAPANPAQAGQASNAIKDMQKNAGISTTDQQPNSGTQTAADLGVKTRSLGSATSADNPEAAMGAGAPAPTAAQSSNIKLPAASVANNKQIDAANTRAWSNADPATRRDIEDTTGTSPDKFRSMAGNNASQAATTGGTSSTTSSQNVSGTLKMGRADGPIQYNGKTVNPGDPDYAAAEQALIAAGQRRQQMRTQMSRDWQAQQRAASGAAPAPVQQGASLGSRDFEESLDRLKQLWKHKG